MILVAIVKVEGLGGGSISFAQQRHLSRPQQQFLCS